MLDEDNEILNKYIQGFLQKENPDNYVEPDGPIADDAQADMPPAPELPIKAEVKEPDMEPAPEEAKIDLTTSDSSGQFDDSKNVGQTVNSPKDNRDADVRQMDVELRKALLSPQAGPETKGQMNIPMLSQNPAIQAYISSLLQPDQRLQQAQKESQFQDAIAPLRTGLGQFGKNLVTVTSGIAGIRPPEVGTTPTADPIQKYLQMKQAEGAGPQAGLAAAKEASQADLNVAKAERDLQNTGKDNSLRRTGQMQKYLEDEANSKNRDVVNGLRERELTDKEKKMLQETGLTPEAIDALAEQTYRTGKLPSIGMGAAGIAIRTAVTNRMSELHPGANLASNQSDYESNKGSQKHLQTQADTTESFEKTAKANLSSYLASAQKLMDAHSPLLNRPLRWLQKNSGNPEVAAYLAAHEAAAKEIAKVLSGSLGNQAVSDAGAGAAHDMLNPNYNIQQSMAAGKILLQDMENRTASNKSTLEGIRGRNGATAPQPSSPGEKTMETVKVRRKSDGKVVEVSSLQEASQKYLRHPDLFERVQ